MMRRGLTVVALLALLGSAPAGDHALRAAGQETPSAQRALLDQYCVTCHNERLRVADLTLDTVDVSRVADHPEVWEKVVRKMRAGAMPPAPRPRPDQAAYDGFRSWLEAELDQAAAADPNPGRTETFHRLSRAEYHNAVRDLLHLDVDVSELLPADDTSYGFDNIAGVLGVSPTLMER
jgi:mono/diheme cytochrome c family protein